VKGYDDTVVLSQESGFSLLEVVIALVILMTLLVSVASLLATTFKVGANLCGGKAATEIATSTLDSQVQQGSTTLVTEVGDTSLPSVTSAGQTYIVEMEISPYTSSNASACANPNGGLAMLKITVWVTWANVTTGSQWWVSGSSGSTGLLVSETTLLSLPSTAFNGNDGSVLVAITGTSGSADGIQSVSVTATSGSTHYTAATTSSGCVLFANLAPGTWTMTASKTGYIDALNDWSTSTNSATPLSSSAVVTAGNVTSLGFTYDNEATVTPSYSAPADGGQLTPNPTGISTLPLTYYTTYGTSYPATGVVLPSPSSVFPSNTSPSYYVVAGSCGIESAPDGNNITGAQTDGQAITVTPGGTANPAFALTPLELVVTHGGTPVANAAVTATSTDSNCATGSLAMPTLGLGTTCNPGGPTYPCTYQLAAHRIFHGRHRPDIILATSTTMSIASSSGGTTPTSTYGSPVTFTATVSRSGGSGTPTGTVTFTQGPGAGTAICTGVSLSSISSFQAQATCTTSSLAVTGGVSIKATYSPTGSFTVSGPVTLTQVVTTAPATAALTWSPIPSAYGNTVLLTANVTANSPSTATPTGTVTFQQGSTNIPGCVNVAVTSGAATCSVSGLVGGSYTMKATYTASGNFSGPSSSTLTQSVTAASTTTTVSSSANPSTYGQSVTFTATVASATGAVAVGKVNFTDGGTTIGTCGTVTVTAGVATCTTTSLPVGAQSISAVFTPTTSTNFAASTGTLTQQVNLAVSTPYLLVGMPVGVWTVKVVYGSSTMTFSLTITPGESALLLQEAD
jgi:Big-like domain-containing protein